MIVISVVWYDTYMQNTTVSEQLSTISYSAEFAGIIIMDRYEVKASTSTGAAVKAE